MYSHEIKTKRETNMNIAIIGAGHVHATVGIAPINLLNNPSEAVNVPVLVSNCGDVKECLGFSENYDYTLMQVALASLQKMGVGPIVMINVINPENPKHVTVVASISYSLTNGSVKLKEEGILLDKLVVSAGENVGVANKDYIASFDANGYVDIAVTDDGIFNSASEISVAYTKLNPKGVTEEDIIGGITEDGTRAGIELVDEIYSRFGLIPDILSAPKYSSHPAVATALEAKAELAGDLTNAIAVIDIESETTTTLEQLQDAKSSLGILSRWAVLCWPKVILSGHEIYASAVTAALLQYEAAHNNGIPTSPDNKSVPIDGVVVEGGREIHLTQRQVNDYMNAIGITSFVYMGGWKFWGNNTAAYPNSSVPNERFIKCVMLSNYLENRFKTDYLSMIGTDGSYKMVDSVVSNYNADLNALVPDYIAGAEVTFDKNENPVEQIMSGHFVFHTRYADYTPTEYIENTFTWDSEILENALGGES